MPFSNRRMPTAIMPKPADIPWVQLVAPGWVSKTQTVGDGEPRLIPMKRAWRPAGWHALTQKYVLGVGQPDREASDRVTNAPWNK